MSFRQDPFIRPCIRDIIRSVIRPVYGGIAFTIAQPIAQLFANSEVGLFADIQNLGSLWQEEAMTTPSAIGDPVGMILDQSGTGHHLVNATSGQKPLLRQDASGHYYLECDGLDDKLVATFAIAPGDCTLVFAGPDEITVRTVTVGTTFELHTGLCYGLLLIDRALTADELGSIL